jgi:hypothetical protein
MVSTRTSLSTGGCPRHPVQQRGDAQPGQHARRGGLGDGQNGPRHVAHRLRGDASGADHEHGTEHVVGAHAEQQFHAAGQA